MRLLQKARIGGALTLGLLAAGSFVGSAHAQSAVETFYKGRILDLYIGFTSGGTYDTYSRLVAQFMGDHIPGKPKIVPKQMVGAGSRAAATHIFNIAPKDGTQLATADQALAMQQVLNDPGIQFDANKFIWIGNPIADNNTMAAWTASGVTSIDEAKKREFVVGANGITASAQYPQAMNVLLGTKFKLISGYEGAGGLNLALERGEIEVVGANSWVSLAVTKPEWIKDRKITPLYQTTLKRDPEIADTPTLLELAPNERAREIITFQSRSEEIGFYLIAPPDTPADRVEILRSAFASMARDAAYLAEAKSLAMGTNFMSGQALQDIELSEAATRKEIVDQFKVAASPIR